MKKIIIIVFALTVLYFVFFSGSKDPMNMPMEASSIEEYGESMIKISKMFNKSWEKDEFLSALQEVAYGPDIALTQYMAGDFMNLDREMMTKLARKCDGKTPKEIIEMAEEERNLKFKIKLHSEDKEQMDEILKRYEIIRSENAIFLLPKIYTEPKETQGPRYRESEQKRNLMIQTLTMIETDIRNWRNINNYSEDVIPTRENIESRCEGCWYYGSFGEEYTILEDGTPACIYKGKVYTKDSRELRDSNILIE